MSFVLRRLCKSAENYCEFLTCQTEECRGRVRKMMLLYMRVRIYHSLKRSNATNVEDKSVKQNRKMLKLSHLYCYVNLKYVFEKLLSIVQRK